MLFRGLLVKAIRFANFTGFYIGFRLLWPSRRFAFGWLLMVDGCYFLCSTLRKKKDKERTRGSVVFTLFECGGVFLGALKRRGSSITLRCIMKSVLFVECQQVMKITLFRGHPRGWRGGSVGAVASQRNF